MSHALPMRSSSVVARMGKDVREAARDEKSEEGESGRAEGVEVRKGVSAC